MKTKQELTDILDFVAEYASYLLGSGVHTSRVIRNAQRIGTSQGVDIQLSSFQKSIIITVHDERSGEVVTRVVKIPALPISFERNSDLSALSWDAVDEHLSLTDLRDRYGELIGQAAYGPDFRPADGRPGECLLLSSVRRGLDGRGHRLHLDARRFFRSAADAGACRESLPGFYPFRLSGFALRLVGIGLRLYGRGGDSHQPLFLVPGVPLINGVIDIVEGHILIGCSRLINALLLIVCIAVGLSAT